MNWMKHRTTRWVALCSGLMLTLFAIGIQPGHTQASSSLFSPAVIGGLHPDVRESVFRDMGDGHWDLCVLIDWTCFPGYNGINHASGQLRFFSVERDVAVEVPFVIGDVVLPGMSLRQELPIQWSPIDPNHRWLRDASVEDIRVRIIPEEIAWRSPPETPVHHEPSHQTAHATHRHIRTKDH